jgi:hypothetical protein
LQNGREKRNVFPKIFSRGNIKMLLSLCTIILLFGRDRMVVQTHVVASFQVIFHCISLLSEKNIVLEAQNMDLLLSKY